MSLGGIGTGTVSLGERDDLRNWEIMNRSSKGFVPKQGDSWFGAGPSVLLHTCNKVGSGQNRLRESPVGCPVNNHNFPRMGSVAYRTAYPLAEVVFGCAPSRWRLIHRPSIRWYPITSSTVVSPMPSSAIACVTVATAR